jgi:hypothetical protein
VVPASLGLLSAMGFAGAIALAAEGQPLLVPATSLLAGLVIGAVFWVLGRRQS